jgi:hypothetical protein
MRKKWSDLKRFLVEAGNSPISSPVGRAFVLRVGCPATVVTALATDKLFNVYNAAKARGEFIDAHNLPLSPPDPIPALVCGILGAVVTLSLVGAMWEVATGKTIIALPRLAIGRFTRFAKSAPARLRIAVAQGTGGKSSAPAATGR